MELAIKGEAKEISELVSLLQTQPLLKMKKIKLTKEDFRQFGITLSKI